MMCHSVEVARYLLTEPGKGRESLKLTSANATIANLKWTRPRYVEQLKREMGPEIDYFNHPAEDFARGTLTLEDEAGETVMIEATTSWSYVGPGLRIQLELLGPEYAMEFSTLNTGLKVFLSRNVTGAEGEDLVEKQSAEQGPDAGTRRRGCDLRLHPRRPAHGRCVPQGEEPLETFRDGVAVVEMLMALYRSAEIGSTVHLPEDGLETYIPPVARGEYHGYEEESGSPHTGQRGERWHDP
jgi:predicted dehydrogenase